MTQKHWHAVNNAEAAQALLDPERLKNFAVFFQEQSLSKAAKILNQPVSSLKYHLEKFIEWGLVVHSRTEPRKGKPIKYYQAVAEQIFIPFETTNHETWTQMMHSLQAPLLKQYCTDFVLAAQDLQPEASQGGMCLRVLENNRHSLDFSALPPPNINFQPDAIKPLWNSWTTIHLTAQQAISLHQEITQLWSRVLQENSQAQPNTRAYTLHLGFTPQS